MHPTQVVIREVQRNSLKCDSFLLSAFVSRVNRRIAIRMVRFCLSTKDVLMNLGSESPCRILDITPERHAGEYLASGESNCPSRQTSGHCHPLVEGHSEFVGFDALNPDTRSQNTNAHQITSTRSRRMASEFAGFTNKNRGVKISSVVPRKILQLPLREFTPPPFPPSLLIGLPEGPNPLRSTADL